MSQRPPASRPASRSPPDGQRIVLPPVQLRDDLQQGGRSTERPQQEIEGRGARPQLQGSPQYSRMPQPSPSGEEWRTPASSRDLGVHSILNPSEPEGSASSSRRLSGGTTESPLSVLGPQSHFGASPSTATTHSFSSQNVPSSTPPTAESYAGAFSRAPRRILTPRSPARAVSTGRGGLPVGNFDPQRSPFLPARGRSYMAEPGPSASSDAPPMPTPPNLLQQQQYGFPPSSSTPSIAPRRPSGPMQAPGRTPLSQSASPSISVSSHGPSSSQTSPASFVVHKSGPSAQTATSYYPGSSFATSMQQQGSGMQFPGPSGPAEGPYSAPAPQTQSSSLQSSSTGSSRQTSASEPIQVLTITTSQGSYHVPVDVHQASRLADEKRARNAGASARFRQRRKEKEREANSSIEKLQQQTRDLERKVKDLEQERDFYRMERDRFRDVVVRNPELRHLATQAPPSPQTMRSGSFQGPMMGGHPPPHPPPLGFGSESGPERAPRRRRTDTQGEFTSLTYGAPSTSLAPVQPAGYPPGPSSGPSGLPPMRTENPNVPHSTSSGLPPTTTSGGPPPFDPYSRGPYERGWPGERR